LSKVAQEVEALLDKGDTKGAFKVVNAGLNKDPDDMAALMMAACIVSREGNWGIALNLLKRVKEKSPPFPEVLNNLGMCLSSLASNSGKDHYLDEAENCLRKAMHKKPLPEVISNLALVLMHKCNVQGAEKLCRDGLELDPSNVSLRETLGYACLYQGKWVEGFGNYEFNLGNKYRKIPPGTYWERGTRGTLFVQGEQGIGDEITYASVLPDASKDNKITYECDHRLAGLMKRSLPGVEIHGTRFEGDKSWKEGREFDRVALTASLCMEYRREDSDFPRKGFLVADPERRLQWKALLDTLPGKKVGIAWTGGLDHTFKSRRSFNLEGLLPILKTPGITWVSLQYTDPTEEIAAFKAKHGIEIKHWPRAAGKYVDYDETAALVSELDAVVSVTTAVVHLCGALGQKCYVLVPARARWFYASADSKHRWYDSLELFRQQDKWPVEKVAEKLKNDLRPL
jgi:tetratricopeptide (TPR) repeat protein